MENSAKEKAEEEFAEWKDVHGLSSKELRYIKDRVKYIHDMNLFRGVFTKIREEIINNDELKEVKNAIRNSHNGSRYTGYFAYYNDTFVRFTIDFLKQGNIIEVILAGDSYFYDLTDLDYFKSEDGTPLYRKNYNIIKNIIKKIKKISKFIRNSHIKRKTREELYRPPDENNAENKGGPGYQKALANFTKSVGRGGRRKTKRRQRQRN